MKYKLRTANILDSQLNLSLENKLLINTINAHSYNVAQEDIDFQKSLNASHVLLPDGISIVIAIKILTGKKIKRITGADLFQYEMSKLNEINGSCFFLGSTNETLDKIICKASIDFPKVKINVYSPPYKPEFNSSDNTEMLKLIKAASPDVLFIGMTAPKQEKWAHSHYNEINANHICSIGAVFDFYAGNIKRAPKWIQNIGLEWFYRLISEPRRMWKRYLIGNLIFIFNILKEILVKE